MYLDTADIRNDFKELEAFSFQGNHTIGSIYQSFNCSSEEGNIPDRGFSIDNRQRADRPFGMNDTAKIKEFALLLMEYGNIEYCRKIAKIGRHKAIQIVHILNQEAERRSLAPVYCFKRKDPFFKKLTDKQVSIIKYLLHKGYSGKRLASIYNVTQGLIANIDAGLQHKDITPIIPLSGARKRPLYSSNSMRLPDSTIANIWLLNEGKSNVQWEWIIWENTPKCPRCQNNSPYLLSNGGHRCSNPQCKLQFSPMVGTPFEGTKIQPKQWLAAMALYENDMKISARSMAVILGVTQVTSWKMIQRLKQAYLLPLWQRFTLINKEVRMYKEILQ